MGVQVLLPPTWLINVVKIASFQYFDISFQPVPGNKWRGMGMLHFSSCSVPDLSTDS